LDATDPSLEVLDAFEPRAKKLFLGLNIKSMAPSGLGPSDFHIEFRRLPVEPYPIVVFVVIPFAYYTFKVIRLPSTMELTPYLSTTFRFIWLCLAYELYLGVEEEPYRPAVITVLDRQGDKAFGNYLREMIGPNCGTKVRVVNHDLNIFVPTDGDYRPETLRNIMSEMESSFGQIMGGMLQREPVPQTSLTTNSSSSSSTVPGPWSGHEVQFTKGEAIKNVESLKQKGNGYFQAQRYRVAKKCYTEAMDIVRKIVEPGNEVFVLLGVLLSNRAACNVKLVEEGRNNESSLQLLNEAIEDCTNAQESPWSSLLSSNIHRKLTSRKEIAINQKNDVMERIKHNHFSFEEDKAERIAKELIEEEEREQEQQRQRLSPSRQQSRSARQRQRRRRNKKNRERAENSENPNVPAQDQVSTATKPKPGLDCLLMRGKQLCESRAARNVTRHDDWCPICYKTFGLELSESFSAVLTCKHGFCVSCISMLKAYSDASDGHRLFECSQCKKEIPPNLMDSIATSILEQNESLQALTHELSETIEDSAEVVCRLLEANQFDLFKVENAIESMLTARSRSDLYSDRNLSYQDKKAIYDEARKPVEVLRQQLDQARAQLRTIYDDESTEWRVCYERILEIRRNLIHAEENARHTIYERINSAGGMGISMEDQDISQDFHGLHVTEAITMFDHQVKPVLPVVRRMILITGWGRHSDNGTSVVQQALKDHIDSEENRSLMRWHMIDDNMGAIKVTWIG
jgi:DNA-directed RNA polymerase subunit M/transcription elongation factor TFIIS